MKYSAVSASGVYGVLVVFGRVMRKYVAFTATRNRLSCLLERECCTLVFVFLSDSFLVTSTRGGD